MSLGTAHTYYLHMSEDMKTCTFGVDSDYVDLAAEVFALLADPTRIRIILSLRDGEMSVKDLADIVGKRPTAVSQHRPAATAPRCTTASPTSMLAISCRRLSSRLSTRLM